MSDDKDFFGEEEKIDGYVIRHRDLDSITDIKRVSDPPPRQAPAALDSYNEDGKTITFEGERKDSLAEKVDVEKVFMPLKMIVGLILSAAIAVGIFFLIQWVLTVYSPSLEKTEINFDKPPASSAPLYFDYHTEKVN